MIGTLQKVNSGGELRFVRNLRHSPEKVWRAITEPQHLKAWFPDGIEGDFVVGGKLRFGVETDHSFDGEVLIVDPPRLLEFTWGPDQLRIELVPDGDGTVMTFVDTFDEYGKAARDGAGWHECIDHLERELDGSEQRPWGETWKEVHPQYVATFPPEASTVGPPSM